MKKQLTVNQLYDICKKTVDSGYGEALVFFDTEARQALYHEVAVCSAGFQGQEERYSSEDPSHIFSLKPDWGRGEFE